MVLSWKELQVYIYSDSKFIKKNLWNKPHLILGQKDHPNAGKFLCSDGPTLSSVVEQETLKSHKKMYQRRIQDIKKSAIPKFVCPTLHDSH